MGRYGKAALQAATGFGLAFAAAFTAAGQVREIPAIPPTVTDAQERRILGLEIERLRAGRDRLVRARQSFARDCNSGPASVPRMQACDARYEALRRQTEALGRSIETLARSLRRAAAARPAAPADDPDARRRTADAEHRARYGREALDAGPDGWPDALAWIDRETARRPGDPALRDAAAHLRGIHSGRFNADNLADAYYRHGVRRGIAGDFWSAGLAFAMAARRNRGDYRVFRSYAHVAGLQNAAPACRRAGRCISGSMPGFGDVFGPDHVAAFRVLDESRHRPPGDALSQRAVDLLRALSVYAAHRPRDGNVPEAAAREARRALAELQAGRPGRAALRYVAAWTAVAPERSYIFLKSYAQGLAEGSPATAWSPLDHPFLAARFPAETRRAALERARAPADAPGGSDARAAFRKIRDALDSGAKSNPFRGRLSREQIVRMQR